MAFHCGFAVGQRRSCCPLVLADPSAQDPPGAFPGHLGHRVWPTRGPGAWQPEVFTAIVVDGIPPDALVIKLGSGRSAICKMMFDARRKLRAALAADGYLPQDVGCPGRH